MLYIVVVIHGVFWLNLLPQAVGSLLLFEIPVSFLIAGAAYRLSLSGQPHRHRTNISLEAYRAYVLSRLIRILVPYWAYASCCVMLLWGVSFFDPRVACDLPTLAYTWLNPFTFGTGCSMGLLGWHLWFVPVFLVVTALLPLAIRVLPMRRPPLVGVFVGTAAVLWVFGNWEFAGVDFIRQVFFYLVCAVLGYVAIDARKANRPWSLALAAMAACTVLAWGAGYGNWPTSMDMQINKFPPNHLFAAFTTLWLVLWVAALRSLPALGRGVDALGSQRRLRAFFSAGYSTFLWHGLAYTIALKLGTLWLLHWTWVWAIAVVLAMGLGALTWPIEKWRWPTKA